MARTFAAEFDEKISNETLSRNAYLRDPDDRKPAKLSRGARSAEYIVHIRAYRALAGASQTFVYSECMLGTVFVNVPSKR